MAFLEPPLKLDPKALAPAGILQGQVHRSPRFHLHRSTCVLEETGPGAVTRLDLRSHHTAWIYKLHFSLRAEKYVSLKSIICSA